MLDVGWTLVDENDSHFDRLRATSAALAGVGVQRSVASAEEGLKKPDPRLFARAEFLTGVDGIQDVTLGAIVDLPEERL